MRARPSVPTISCGASPSAHVTKDAFERIVNEMSKAQAGIGPVYSGFEFRAVGGFDARYGPWVSANAPGITLVGNLGNGF